MIEQVFKFGRVPDTLDSRDYNWRDLIAGGAISLPPSKVYNNLGPILDQGATFCCVAYSMASVKMEEEFTEESQYYDFDPDELYARCKQQDGMPDVDGTFIRIALKIVQHEGIKTKCGKLFKIADYFRLDSLEQIKEALIIDGPLMFGISWEQGLDVFTGDDLPNPGGNVAGGHCTVITGYDDTKQALRIKNSWGVDWGNQGYAWMPYKWLDQYPWDIWKVIDAKNIESKIDGHS